MDFLKFINAPFLLGQFFPLLTITCTNSLNSLSLFLIPLLNPISVNSLMIKDSFSFVQELLNSDIDSSKVLMASFEVTSLFTNIPLNETIDIISNRIFSNCQRFQGLNRPEFEKLLTLSVKNCHFMFNSCLFHQIDGVAMGSRLGPLFANIFMSFHEKNMAIQLSFLFQTSPLSTLHG